MARKSWIWIAALGAVLLLVIGAAFALREPITYARIAVGYTAQQTCACLHVSGRALDSCLGDYPAEAISKLKIEPDGDRVRVSALGVFKAEAVYDEQFGCRLIN